MGVVVKGGQAILPSNKSEHEGQAVKRDPGQVRRADMGAKKRNPPFLISR